MLGAVALSIYHDGAYYVPGGLYQVAERLKASAEADGAIVLLGRKNGPLVRQTADGFLLEDRRGRLLLADAVIGALPLEAVQQFVNSVLESVCRPHIQAASRFVAMGDLHLLMQLSPETIIQDDQAFRQIHDPMLPSGHAFITLSRSGRSQPGTNRMSEIALCPVIFRFAGSHATTVRNMTGKLKPCRKRSKRF